MSIDSSAQGVDAGSTVPRTPDYELDDRRILTTPQELRALTHRIRDRTLELLHERAATVNELAMALGKPSSTVAYHVGVLVDAGMLKVVRTRKVRAIEERYYGRTARLFMVGQLTHEGFDPEKELANLIVYAGKESGPAHRDDDVRALLRHVRIPKDTVREFWERVAALANDFSSLPRDGDQVYGFIAGLYPTDYPVLPAPKGELPRAGPHSTDFEG